MRADLGFGRFGQIFLAEDPASGQRVVIRIFSRGFTDDQRTALLAALEALCARPLDHASIAAPLASGVSMAGDDLYIAHAYLPGITIDSFVVTNGAQSLVELLPRVTRVAAALDFAAAAGVHHGALTARDVIVDGDRTAISGLGLLEALVAAGVAAEQPSRADDVRALAVIALEALCGAEFSSIDVAARVMALPGVVPNHLLDAFEAALSPYPDLRPTTALDFAARLQAAMAATTIGETAGPSDTLRLSPSLDQRRRPGTPGTAGRAETVDPTYDTVPPAPDTAYDIPLHSDSSPDSSGSPGSLSARSSDLLSDDVRSVHLQPGRDAVHLHGDHAHEWDHAVVAAEPPPHRAWLPMAVAALLIGLAAGFGGGYLVGWRGATAAAVMSTGAGVGGAAETAAGADGRAATAAAEPAATSGRSFTDAPVGAAPEYVPSAGGLATPTPVPPTAAPPTPSASSATTSPSAAAPGQPVRRESSPTADARVAPSQDRTEPTRRPSGSGALLIESRPTGAQVTVDGTIVGRTPLVLGEVTAGSHRIGLDLPGYRSWNNAVTVDGGVRTRVAASLEQ